MSADQSDEQAIFDCPGCGKRILTFWAPNGGGLLRGEYVLAGDLIWHPKCFDTAYERFAESASVPNTHGAESRTGEI